MSHPHTPPTPSGEEVIGAIAALFAKRRSSAALAHYPTLRIQTTNLHSSLAQAIKRIDKVVDSWSETLAKGSNIAPELQKNGSFMSAYKIIAPALVRTLHHTSEFLLEESKAAPAVDVDRVSETVPSFSDHVRLGASVRGFIDALIQTAYQLYTFDGLQLNYKFLHSLLSFVSLAPNSLHSNIASPEIQSSVDAFASLSKRSRKDAPFCKATNDPFAERLKEVCRLAALPDWRHQNLHILFGFCSDFVHSGYISVLALKGDTPELVAGGPGDAFTPRAENFAELKLRLLSECAGAYSDLLIPSLRAALSRTLSTGIPIRWVSELDAATLEITAIRAVLYRRLVEPIRKGFLDSKQSIHIECTCGGDLHLSHPFAQWDRFCPKCGSIFHLQEVPEEVDYVISPSGPGDVLGGDAIKILRLSQNLKDKLKRIHEKHHPKSKEDSVAFVLIRDLLRCEEDTLAVPSIITSTPNDLDKADCSIYAFVSAKSIERCTSVRIECNCGSQVEYQTESATLICSCPNCSSKIGLLAVAGDGLRVMTSNPDGSKQSVPIQSRRRFIEAGIGIN